MTASNDEPNTAPKKHPASSDDLPEFVTWPAFPFEGKIRLKKIDDPVEDEPPRKGEDSASCTACHTSDSEYLWTNERWRVKTPPKPSGLPIVMILEPRAHLDIGDLSTMHAAELGLLTVRLERAIRSLDTVARVHITRWGDGSAHLQQWFLARPKGYVQLRGPFMTMWDEILPPVDEKQWKLDLEYICAWMGDE